MSVNLHLLRKWFNMVLGRSVYHVNQGVGTLYSKSEIKGYYNDLTEKVSKFGREDNQIPTTVVDSGKEVYFSIAIFQYGLGAYDLYLKTGEKGMLEKTVSCADWATDNQQKDGSWQTFSFETPEHPYSSMAQGEGISLLLRAYCATGEQRYLDAASKAKEFMLLPIEKGGTALYIDSYIYLYEYTHQPLILNGFIFSIWGLFDYYLLTNDSSAKKTLDVILLTLEKKLPDYDIRYWSKYDDGKRICSPFYHNLHIAQLKVMYDLFGNEIFKEYAEKWEAYQKSFWKPKKAFVKKALQKILE